MMAGTFLGRRSAALPRPRKFSRLLQGGKKGGKLKKSAIKFDRHWHGNINFYLEQVRKGNLMVRDETHLSITCGVMWGAHGWEVWKKGELEIALAIRVHELEREARHFRYCAARSGQTVLAKREAFYSRRFP